MRIIYVDDETNALINFEYEVRELECVSTYNLFTEAQLAIDYVKNHEVDVAFLDIELRDRMGTELAKELQEIHPDIVIVYVTAYSNYTLEAYQTNGRAYLLKPYSREELEGVFRFLGMIFKDNSNKINNAVEDENIEEEIGGIPSDKRIFIKTFGSFDIFLDGQPIIFKNAKAKELLALLVDKKGGVLTNEEIFTYLWEERNYTRTTSTYVRKTIQALRSRLEENGCEGLVSFYRNSLYFNYTLFQKRYLECDSYSVLEGDQRYIDAYSGSYMARYSWAEDTIYMLENKMHNYLK